MSWADMIRDALAEDRFVLHAQPIIDLATGEATQYELLLRMRGADGELIGPSAFLPVAERFDLMAAIDRWVVTRAIRMVGAERRRGRELIVEVNISGRSAGDPELLALIEQRAAHERRLPEPDHLRDHRDDRGLEHPARPALRGPPRRPRLPLRARRLRRRLRLLLLPQAPALRLPQDRRRVRAPLRGRHDGPARDPGRRRHRARPRQAHGGRARRRRGDRRAAARMGVDHAQGFHLGKPAPLGDWLPSRAVALARAPAGMRALVQRVARAAVRVEGAEVAAIGPGLLVLLGVTHDDTEAQADRLADKLRALRVFPDAEGRMNEPLGDREVLCVSQFTLYGDARRGNRPSYVDAARPEHAEPLYERFCERLGAQRGVFGAIMEVELVNDGPVTLLLEL